MVTRVLLLIGLTSLSSTLSADQKSFRVATSQYHAEFSFGSLASLAGSDGKQYVRKPVDPIGVGIHRIDGEHAATQANGDARLDNGTQAVRRYRGFTDLDGGTAQCAFRLDKATGDLVLQQKCFSPAKGVWGLSWSIAEIPLEYAILVPGRSGVRLTAQIPGRRHQFDYPVGWEAQLVVVEGPDSGFYVWADDVGGRFKRLVVERSHSGWTLQLVTINFAPFDELATCNSVAWHLNVYQGDWRVPARRYREWAEANLRPTPVERQEPDWVKEIRCLVIMGLDRQMAEALAGKLDPKQTVLYIPAWRAAGYDRDYPVYDRPVAELKPFMDRAHELGFRVMLHVNYFGVDPLNPLYERFEPHQVRDSWGDHEKLWWLWTRAEPEIRFAYINPALRAWRRYFVDAMIRLCRSYHVDALHLDQTLCLFNDHNGLVEGKSMIDGNLALHRELREALPEVALSGEGLNEITFRHEAFAQRHAWGVSHTERTWDRRLLAAAHPISSYLFRPYTIINGYLGCAPPTSGQLYAAWNDCYEHWGVIPTLKPNLNQLHHPTEFSRQFFDEVTFWQNQRLDIDLEGPWPDRVAFPFNTRDGRPALRTTDGRFLCGDHQVSRTITGVNRVEATGTVPGWRAYDGQGLMGLDPDSWYPYFDDPRPSQAFHVVDVPGDTVVDSVIDTERLAILSVRPLATVVADFTEMLDGARCGSRPFEGEPVETTGPLQALDGAHFLELRRRVISSHPPWKAMRTDQKTGRVEKNGTGAAYARFSVDLPSDCRLAFLSDVALDSGALGPDKTDGVTFAVTARCDGQKLHNRLHHASDKPATFELDLSPLAGRTVTVELSVHPGPNRSASFDWARWFHPRIRRQGGKEGSVAVAGSGPWKLALGADGPVPFKHQGEPFRTKATVPGSVTFLKEDPRSFRLPVDIVELSPEVVFSNNTGQELQAPDHAAVQPSRFVVGGVARDGLFTHPPDQGRTIALFPVVVPKDDAVFRSWIGIRDGSKSEGVVFAVEVNGRDVVRRKMRPGAWGEIRADLSPWAGEPIVLALIVDSDGSFRFDWACWGEPILERNPRMR